MVRSANNNTWWLNRFAVLTAAATFVLIGIGGLVTSKGVGMAVPDWPTTYGYNMFLFPISEWVGGIFYEHTHRLVATVVGTLVVALTRWLGGQPARKPLAIIGILEVLIGVVLPYLNPKLSGAGYFLSGIGGVVLLAAVVWVRNEPSAHPLPQLGWLAFAAVQVQGLLGGLRVVLYYDQIGILHAALAQAFFALLCVIALVTSQWWRDLEETTIRQLDRFHLRPVLLFATGLIFAQLIVGATMRHQHAGLAIPDFPLAYHKLWPPTDPASVASYNQNRLQVSETNPVTAFQIVLQMVHRLLALLILCAVAFCAAWTRRLRPRHLLARWSLGWLALILVQILLGAATIWSNKAADIATLHVLSGALSLVLSALLTVVSFRVLIPVRTAVPAAAQPAPAQFAPAKPSLSGARYLMRH
jgi:cytochrome c oxidase assembly protein subunit 15